jgi:hypothetical protein
MVSLDVAPPDGYLLVPPDCQKKEKNIFCALEMNDGFECLKVVYIAAESGLVAAAVAVGAVADIADFVRECCAVWALKVHHNYHYYDCAQHTNCSHHYYREMMTACSAVWALKVHHNYHYYDCVQHANCSRHYYREMIVFHSETVEVVDIASLYGSKGFVQVHYVYQRKLPFLSISYINHDDHTLLHNAKVYYHYDQGNRSEHL